MPGGRPPKYNSSTELEAAIDAYFDFCEAGKETEIVIWKRGKAVDVKTVQEKIHYTLEDLALFCGFNDRSGLWRYGKKDDEFSNLLSRARTRITADRIKAAMSGQADSKFTQFVLERNNPDYQPKIALPEGAQILIAYTSTPGAGTDADGTPALPAPTKPIQITD